MIEIKAKAEILNENGCEAGISISNTTEGRAGELLHESLAVVRSVAHSLRDSNPLLLMMFLEALQDDHSILLGEEVEEVKKGEDKDEHSDAEKLLAKLMSKAIIGEEGN